MPSATSSSNPSKRKPSGTPFSCTITSIHPTPCLLLVTILLSFSFYMENTSHFVVAFVLPNGDDVGTYHSRRSNSNPRSSSGDITELLSNNGDEEQNDVILKDLPIFPLRKSPRLPTDRLTLNLYEERYLALAESILGGGVTMMTTTLSPKLFGALFVAGMPHLVEGGGRGRPIVPLVQKGDIGTIFAVEDFEEAMVPTLMGNQILRRRTQLNAIGVGRFRIDSIVSDGTAGSTTNTSTKVEQLPYILVNATVLLDGPDDVPWEEDEYLRLCKMLQDLSPTRGFQTRFDPFRRFSTTRSGVAAQTEPVDEFAKVHAAMIQAIHSSSSSSLWKYLQEDYYYEELFSFFAASRLMSKEEQPKALLPLLLLRSTRERIHRLLTSKQ